MTLSPFSIHGIRASGTGVPPPSIYRSLGQPHRAGVSYLKLTRYDDDATGDVIKPAGKRFRGKVSVLIGPTNSSATFQFAQNVESHHLGTLIGQPTGGSQRGINGGAFFFLRLPHSGIEMDLPLIGTFPPTPAPDAGVNPDILVKPIASDFATGYDRALAIAIGTIGH